MVSLSLAIVEDDTVVGHQHIPDFKLQPEIRDVLVADSIENLLEQLVNALTPQVMLLDIGLPGISGTEALPLLKEKYPVMKIIMLTAYEDVEHIYQALYCGTTGYMVKPTPLNQLKEAVLEVAESIQKCGVARLSGCRHGWPHSGRGLSDRDCPTLLDALLKQGLR